MSCFKSRRMSDSPKQFNKLRKGLPQPYRGKATEGKRTVVAERSAA